MVIAGPIMGSADGRQPSCRKQANIRSMAPLATSFALLFAMFPVVYIAGLVTLVGLQARSALMGVGKGGGM